MATGRRKLAAVDDPLAATPAPAEPAPVEPSRAGDRAATTALYVRLPIDVAERLARAAFELRAHKRELVAALIVTHVDGSSETGRDELGRMLQDYRDMRRSG